MTSQQQCRKYLSPLGGRPAGPYRPRADGNHSLHGLAGELTFNRNVKSLLHVRTSSPNSASCLDQRFGFGWKPSFWLGIPKFGKISSMEYVTKAGLCRRRCRRVNITASRNPVRAPRNPSVTERLLKVRRPWPVRRNPVYAMAIVQKIARRFMAFTPREIPEYYYRIFVRAETYL